MNEHYANSKGLHLNYSIISNLIEEGSSVLDLGCGDGELLRLLKDKKINSRGIEINQDNVIKCLEKGLSVVQGDIDEGLQEYPDKSYDYIVLNQTLQSTEKPDYVIQEMLRVGKKAFVSFPNFGYWRVRFYLLINGKMPKSKILPFEWFDTPNIHLLTIDDFFDFAKKNKIKIEKTVCMTRAKVRNGFLRKIFNNLLTEEVIFVVSKD
ncbi:MAG: methionine biosynthesis protein MetW [Candidatus Gastranaerophilales bacterium]|nr:methionine biosynthesis protein MetW [Candidatus Gastranaerophilales bacterium]